MRMGVSLRVRVVHKWWRPFYRSSAIIPSISMLSMDTAFQDVFSDYNLQERMAGREVYRQEGFRDAWGFKRFVVQRKSQLPAQSGVRELREADWPWILALDRAAFGGNRERMLRSLARRLPAAALVVEGEGFILGRDGKISPVLLPVSGLP